MAIPDVKDVPVGASVRMKDSMEKCVSASCDHRRYRHDGDQGDAACSIPGCLCKGGIYPSDLD